MARKAVPSGVVRVQAPAKINLTLRVDARRADGYHDLRTIFQAVALHDMLTFEVVPGPFRLECDDPAFPTDATNLVWRAAQALWRAGGRRGAARDVHVRLVKRIPAQAGLGGGSSDAAATLRALARLWRLTLPQGKLLAVAARLGADVPFFLAGGTALGIGRGDRLFLLPDLPPAWVTIVCPAFGVSTKDAYTWLDEDRAMGRDRAAARERAATSSRRPRAASIPDVFSRMWPPGELGNDLEPPVRRRHPAVGRLVRALMRRGAAYAAMSGSGSAVFGLFLTERSARVAARSLQAPACRTLVTRTLTWKRYGRLSPGLPDLPLTRSIG
jgi:4-diphosphocytidyl-2-C-methyl-D-erythritol kinase